MSSHVPVAGFIVPSLTVMSTNIGVPHSKSYNHLFYNHVRYSSLYKSLILFSLLFNCSFFLLAIVLCRCWLKDFATGFLRVTCSFFTVPPSFIPCVDTHLTTHMFHDSVNSINRFYIIIFNLTYQIRYRHL